MNSYELLLNSKAKNLRKCLKSFAKKHLINDKEIVSKEITGKKVISNLFATFEDGLLMENEGYLCFDARIVSLLSEEFLEIFLNRVGSKDYKKIPLTKESVYFTLLLIADQISGMTDSHCMALYKKLNGIL